MFKVEHSKKKLNELQDYLDKVSMCSIDVNRLKKGETQWMNPYDQTNLESGWFTLQDFLDLKDGKGKCIKGDGIEKKLRNALAIWKREYDRYCVVYATKDFHFVKDRCSILCERGFPSSNYYVKDENANTSKNYCNKDIIKNAFSRHINHYVQDLEYIQHDRLYNKWRDTSWGIVQTLVDMGIGYYGDMGIGYYGAINTPEEIANLAWYRELVWSRIYYLHLKEKGLTEPLDNFISYEKNPTLFMRKNKLSSVTEG